MSDKSRAERVDDAVDVWHCSGAEETRELHEFLGWTLDEYATWVERNILPPEREGAM